VPTAAGFAAGGLFMRFFDRIIPHLHIYLPIEKAEGIKTSWHKTTLLVLAMSLHNIPEGLVIGVTFGALAHGLSGTTLAASIALVIGIGIQDIPEGLAVSMPLRHKGMRRSRSFWYGQLSGLVEPLGAVIGALAVSFWSPILPYAMGFAAGAMIFIIIEELIPESQYGENGDIATIGTMFGFLCMMVLEVMFC
jgi:ZIP family zinc transporter